MAGLESKFICGGRQRRSRFFFVGGQISPPPPYDTYLNLTLTRPLPRSFSLMFGKQFAPPPPIPPHDRPEKVRVTELVEPVLVL